MADDDADDDAAAGDSDDDVTDQASPFRLPLPPDDRLWRHPSEVGLDAEPAPPPAAGVRTWAVAVSGLAGAVLTLGLVATFAGLRPRVVERPAGEVVPVTPVSFETFVGGRADADVSTVADRIGPAVVRLEVETAGAPTLGSGVVFRDDGHVLTAAHLLAGADRVTALLQDGRELDATIVGVDETTDIAVLKVTGEGFAAAMLGSADLLRVGDPAISIGAPTDRDGNAAVRTGTVVALGRQVDTSSGALHDMIHTDMAIAPTSSGGALVDRFGVVIGITTTTDTADTGLGTPGLAVPVDLARAVADDIVETGRVRRVWLGIEGSDLDPPRAAEAGIDAGAVVIAVLTGSPAAGAGLLEGDVIVAVNGRRVATMSALVSVLRRHDPGDTIRVDFVRNGRLAVSEVRLDDMAAPAT